MFFSLSVPEPLWPSVCSSLLLSGRKLLPALHSSLASIFALPHLPCPACLLTYWPLFSGLLGQCLLLHPALLTCMGPSCSGCSVWHALPSSPPPLLAPPLPEASWGGWGAGASRTPGVEGGRGIIPLFPAFTNEPAIFVSGLICLREQSGFTNPSHLPPCLPQTPSSSPSVSTSSPPTALSSPLPPLLPTHLADPFLSNPPCVPCLLLACPQL